MITVVFWKWRKPGYRSLFEAEHVNIAKAMVLRNTTLPVEFVCITDDAVGLDKDIRPIKLWDNPAPQYGTENRPNCLYRIKAFARESADLIGKKICWFDLDMVITGNIDHIIGAPEDFAMWGDTARVFQYNGSLCLHNIGTEPQVWEDFKGMESLHLAQRAGFQGSDQAWISYKVGTDKRMFTEVEGVYSYKNHYRDHNIIGMIEGCNLVFFHGQYDPWKPDIQARYSWVKEHYRR